VAGRLALLLALAVAGCDHPPAASYQCDAHGRFVITDDMPSAVAVDLLNRNIQLGTLRLEAMDGEQWIDPARLTKAEGCP